MSMRAPLEIERATEACAARLRARFAERVRMVRLFGSWARGDAHAGSDVDLAAVIDGLNPVEWREAVDLALTAAMELDVQVTPFIVSGDHFDELVRRERRIARDLMEQGVAF